MNAEKLTQKSAEAIRAAQTIAQEYGNPQIEQAHLLWALLQDAEGLQQLLHGVGLGLVADQGQGEGLEDTSMIEARKMLAIWMISLRMSGVSARTLNMTSSRRMDRSGSSSCTE